MKVSDSQSVHSISPWFTEMILSTTCVESSTVLPAGPTVSSKPSRLNLNMALEISWAILEESLGMAGGDIFKVRTLKGAASIPDQYEGGTRQFGENC